MKRSTATTQRAAYWQQRIDEQARSAQSVAAWCREQGIAVQSFYWWKSRLARHSAKPAPSLPETERAPFIDLGALRGATLAAGLEIRLDLGDGVLLTIARR